MEKNHTTRVRGIRMVLSSQISWKKSITPSTHSVALMERSRDLKKIVIKSLSADWFFTFTYSFFFLHQNILSNSTHEGNC